MNKSLIYEINGKKISLYYKKNEPESLKKTLTDITIANNISIETIN